MSDASARFALPWLQPGQAQKEMFHNEALATIDLALHPVVQAVGTTVPPGAPAIGQAWALGPTPADAWAGRGGALAGWTGGGWRFVAPIPGMTAWSMADGLPARWTGSGWVVGRLAAARLDVGGVQVVGGQRAAIAAPTGGTVVDVAARATISDILQALRSHGLIAT